jgi:chromosomal replication initiation ATPase DnaA
MNHWVYPGLDHKARIFALNASKSSQIDLNGLLDCCCFVYDITPEEMRSESRIQHLVFARHAFVKIARDSTGMSYSSIADYIGKRNHATALNSYRQADALIQTYEPFAVNFNKIIALSNKAYNVKQAARLLELEII